ncbi:MAG: hypothetical protein KDA49_09755 [Rhodospirillaceae bacterium]|nr:hypothetical protein [Rhodospirillaceae bacterium]MCA8932739.1 hypothetical protein [Rhodospirillaceae bacterium]
MPLPDIGDLLSGPTPSGIPDACCIFPPVATTSAARHKAKNGHAHWLGNRLVITAAGSANYWYIPQAPSGHAHFCVIPCLLTAADAYVISDNYGGCEYHEAYNAHYNLLAFFHVFRGGGKTAQYQLARGWVQRDVIRSRVIASTIGSNWSISHIDTTTKPPTVESKFIRVGGYPNLSVLAEDDGTTPYPT